MTVTCPRPILQSLGMSVGMALLLAAPRASAQIPTVDGSLIASDSGQTCAIADMRDPAQPASTTVYQRAVTCWGREDYHGVESAPTDPRNAQRWLVRRTSSGGPILTGATQVAIGPTFACAAVGGKIACWGENDERELGRRTTYYDADDGYTTDLEYYPTFVTLSSTKDVAQLVTGWSHACAVMSDGTVRCWGFDGWGNVGDGTSNQVTGRTVLDQYGDYWYRDTDASSTGEDPKTVLTTGTTALSNVRSIAAGRDHTCAVLNDGTVRCWGLNDLGQLGSGTPYSGPHYPSVKVAGPQSCLDFDYDAGDPEGVPPNPNLDYWPCSPRAITVPVTVGSPTALAGAVLVSALDRETCVGQDTNFDQRADRLVCWGGDTVLGRQTIDLSTLIAQYGPVTRFWLRNGTPTASGKLCFQFDSGVAGCAMTSIVNNSLLTLTATGLGVYGTGIVGFAADGNLCDVSRAADLSLVYRCRGDNHQGEIQPKFQTSYKNTLWEYWSPYTMLTVSSAGVVAPAAAPASGVPMDGFVSPITFATSTFENFSIEGESTHLFPSFGRSGAGIGLTGEFGTPGVDLAWRSNGDIVVPGAPGGLRYRVGVWALLWDGGGPISLNTELGPNYYTPTTDRQTAYLDPNLLEEWQYLEILTTPVDYIRQLFVELKLAGDGTVFFDDVSITAENDPATNLAPNPGFDQPPFSWMTPSGASASHRALGPGASLYRPNPGYPGEVISWASKANAFPITGTPPSRGYQVIAKADYQNGCVNTHGSFLAGYRRADNSIMLETVRSSVGGLECQLSAALPSPPPGAAKIWTRLDVTGGGTFNVNALSIVPFP